MNEDLYIQLLYKKLQGHIEPEEQSQLDQWIEASEDHRLTVQAIEKAWEVGEGVAPDLQIDLDADFALLEQKIAADEAAEVSTDQEAKIRPLGRKTPYWQIAAAVAALLLFAFLTRNYLSGGAEQWDQLATLEGERVEQQLADGSRVWLNGNSQLEYTTTFTGSERRVRLSGEAFFDITKNADQPFVIETASGEVKVLGTSFNVRDFKAEGQLSVEVVSGKVQLKGLNSTKAIIMTAGESGTLSKQNQQLSKMPQPSNAAAWHTRRLSFADTPLEEALQDIEAFYGFEIELENPRLLKCPFSSTFDNQPLEVVLETINTIFQTESQVQGSKKYQLLGGSDCN